MDDVDDIAMEGSGENRIASLSTDELREEVARLQSLLLVDQLVEDDDGPEEELQILDNGRAYSWLEDITLKYTNGDVYKVCTKQMLVHAAACLLAKILPSHAHIYAHRHTHAHTHTTCKHRAFGKLLTRYPAGRGHREHQKWDGNPSVLQRRFLWYDRSRLALALV